MASRIRATRRSDAGQAIIELALVLPLLMLVMMGIIDFAFMLQQYQVVTNAAREGARIGALPEYSPADVQGRVTSYLNAGGLHRTPTTNSVTFDDVPIVAGGATTVSAVIVTVAYPHDFLWLNPIAQLVGGSFGTVNLTARAEMRVEMPAGAP
jgi:Flp pilus assembly protein TadG